MARVKINIDGDKSNFDAAMKGVKGSLESLKGMVAGAFTVEAIEGLIEKTFDYADSIDKASLRMKMTTEQTQALGIVAKEAGSSLSTIENAFKKIEVARAKALGGDAKNLALFKSLGIGVGELSKSNNTIGLAADLSSAARKGSTDKEGVALQGLGLKKVSGDLAALGDSLQDFDGKVQALKAEGAIIPDEDIANMVRAKDEMEIAGNMLMAHIAPAISAVIEGLEKYYILFKAYWSNIFAAIITMASDTLEYIKHLPTAAINSALGSKTDNLSTNTKAFAGRIGEDLKDTVGTIGTEAAQGLDEYNKSVAAQLAQRAKARENKPEGVSPVTAPKTLRSSAAKDNYSDNLTTVGNMLGASFAGISHVTTQLDLAKNHLKVAEDQTELLQTIANNTADDSDDNDSIDADFQ